MRLVEFRDDGSDLRDCCLQLWTDGEAREESLILPALTSSSIQRAPTGGTTRLLTHQHRPDSWTKKCYCRLVSIYFTPGLWPRPTPLNEWLALSPAWYGAQYVWACCPCDPCLQSCDVWDCGCLCQLNFPLREILKTWLSTILCLPSLFVSL